MIDKKILKYNIEKAQSALHIFENKYPNDKRPRWAIEEAEKYLTNPITKVHYGMKSPRGPNAWADHPDEYDSDIPENLHVATQSAYRAYKTTTDPDAKAAALAATWAAWSIFINEEDRRNLMKSEEEDRLKRSERKNQSSHNYRIPNPNLNITRGRRDFNLRDTIKSLLGMDDLRYEEIEMYNEIIKEGGKTTPKRIRMFYPDKEKAVIKENNIREESYRKPKKSSKPKTNKPIKKTTKKRTCACKKR